MGDERLSNERRGGTSKGMVWIWAAAVSNLLRNYPQLKLPNANQRHRSFKASTHDLWEQLHHEWSRYEKQGANPEVPTLAGDSVSKDICCPHRQLMPPFKCYLVLESDVLQLLKLEEERRTLWEEFSARSIPPRIYRGELPLGEATTCEACRGDKKCRQQVQTAERKDRLATQLQFRVLKSGRLPMDCHQLKVGQYCLIPADWREKWLKYVANTDEPRPPPLDPTSLRCPHDRLLYNPASYFEASQGPLAKDKHPHVAAYVLVPMPEASAIYKTYLNGKDAGKLAEWCSMECSKMEDLPRMYTCSPPPCDICTGDQAIYKLDVKVETEVKGLDLAVGRHVSTQGKSTGYQVKDLIIAEFEFKSVVPEQMLLSINGNSFGDSDPLQQVLGKQTFLRRATLTVEIFEVMMSEPAAKRQRSSLENSNLAGGL